MDDDDLPARLLPRRPAPVEHPPARRRQVGAHRLRPRRPSHPGGHGPPHPVVRRRRDRERRRAALAGSPSSESGIRRSAKPSSGRVSPRSTTATTGSRVSEIDPIELIREAFDLVYSMNLRLPTRFVILDKAIATLGSVTIELYPEFNVFEVAKPYARQLIADRLSPRRLALDVQRETREVGRRRHSDPAAALGRAARALRRRDGRADLESRARRPGASPRRVGQSHRGRARRARRADRLVADRRSRRPTARTSSASTSSRSSASCSPEPSGSGCSGGSVRSGRL